MPRLIEVTVSWTSKAGRPNYSSEEAGIWFKAAIESGDGDVDSLCQALLAKARTQCEKALNGQTSPQATPAGPQPAPAPAPAPKPAPVKAAPTAAPVAQSPRQTKEEPRVSPKQLDWLRDLTRNGGPRGDTAKAFLAANKRDGLDTLTSDEASELITLLKEVDK